MGWPKGPTDVNQTPMANTHTREANGPQVQSTDLQRGEGSSRDARGTLARLPKNGSLLNSSKTAVTASPHPEER